MDQSCNCVGRIAGRGGSVSLFGVVSNTSEVCLSNKD